MKPPRAAKGTKNIPQQKQLFTFEDSPGEEKGSSVGCAGSTFLLLGVVDICILN
jgi:hypothetical protein